MSLLCDGVLGPVLNLAYKRQLGHATEPMLRWHSFQGVDFLDRVKAVEKAGDGQFSRTFQHCSHKGVWSSVFSGLLGDQ